MKCINFNRPELESTGNTFFRNCLTFLVLLKVSLSREKTALSRKRSKRNESRFHDIHWLSLFFRWNPVEKTSEEEMFSESTIHKLIIKQVLLGVEAKADEFNVVEASLFTLTSKVHCSRSYARRLRPTVTTRKSKSRSPC